jgi:hypothetical protein
MKSFRVSAVSQDPSLFLQFTLHLATHKHTYLLSHQNPACRGCCKSIEGLGVGWNVRYLATVTVAVLIGRE